MNRTILAGLMTLTLLPTTLWAQTSKPAEGWQNVTNNVGGPKWGDYSVHMLMCAPGKDADEVIAGMPGTGLWSSTDGGATWNQLGGGKINARPTLIVWDPKDAKTYWVTCIYGTGLFKTTDGGKTFEALGGRQATDSVAIDSSDPQRKLVLVCAHESARSLRKSTDGGKTWEDIGKNLPDKTNHTTNPIIIDAKTYLQNCAGWLPNTTSGIFRTEDAGETWTKVSDQGASGAAYVAPDGAIYWRAGGLLKSTDKGKTWTDLGRTVTSNVVEAPVGSKLGGKEGAIVGWSDKGIFASRDGGKTWASVSNAKLPIKPNALAYDAKRNCIFISQMQAKQISDAIWRLDLPNN